MNTAITPDISPWRELCTDFVTKAIYARHEKELQRFGERGRQTCRQDILYHLDYLQGALAARDPGLFTQYALWLKEVLGSRGVPPAHLSFSFDFMETFFRNNLPAGEADEVAAILHAARTALAQPAPPAIYGQSRHPADPRSEQYRQSILQGQHRSATSLVLDAMRNGYSLTQAAVQLVQPALYQIGNLWQSNQISVSQEHLASAISQNVLAIAYMQASFAPSVGKSAMFACVENNHHSIGLHMLSDAFETAGWDVFNLGANLPIQDLTHEVDSKRPDLLALSISLPNHIATARLTIERLHAEMGAACPEIWVGGLPCTNTQKIWRITKADGWAEDALHALEQIETAHG